MPRATLPTYARLCHIPNLLEAYRFLSRSNLTVLVAKLNMSYPTVRRVCLTSATPRKVTMAKLNKALPFITETTWDIWHERCSQALVAERHSDFATLSSIEAKLRGMLPLDESKPPIHFIPEASIDVAHSMYKNSMEKKTVTFYLSEVHSAAVDVMSSKAGTTRSDFIKSLIDKSIQEDTEAALGLIEILTGKTVELIPPPPPQDEVEVTVEELDTILPSNISADEAIAQLTAELPEDEAQVSLPEITFEDAGIPYEEDLDLPITSIESALPDWGPSSVFTEDSNLTSEELDELYGGS